MTKKNRRCEKCTKEKNFGFCDDTSCSNQNFKIKHNCDKYIESNMCEPYCRICKKPITKQICPACKKHGVRQGCYNRCDQNNPIAQDITDTSIPSAWVDEEAKQEKIENMLCLSVLAEIYEEKGILGIQKHIENIQQERDKEIILKLKAGMKDEALSDDGMKGYLLAIKKIKQL